MKKILIYIDKGVDSSSFQSIVESLEKNNVSFGFEIEKIDSKFLLESCWQKDCELLVIPGGRDIPYYEALKGKGVSLISEYVNSGGSYLGICAGAYFASNEIVFEKDKLHEVVEKRDLSFFPGRAVGTIYSDKPFSYQSQRSAHSALIQHADNAIYTYYNGGCYFEKAEDFSSDVEILAQYKNANLHNVAAIVLCQVGRGKALLSGVHFEISCDSIKNTSLFEKLSKDEHKRQKLFDKLITRLLV